MRMLRRAVFGVFLEGQGAVPKEGKGETRRGRRGVFFLFFFCYNAIFSFAGVYDVRRLCLSRGAVHTVVLPLYTLVYSRAAVVTAWCSFLVTHLPYICLLLKISGLLAFATYRKVVYT